MDIYEIFQLEFTASPSEIRQQYNKLMIQWHPDKNPDCGQVCDEKF
jgi:DnaJ-class molecular chaperone